MDDPEGFYQASIKPFSKGTMLKAKLQSKLGTGKSRLMGQFIYQQQKILKMKPS